MCGIAGFYGKGDVSIGKEMINSIAYRGPDFQDAIMFGDVCLGHARLSIMDVSPSGHQPMFNADKSLVLIFNGEIYNYLELKEKILKKKKYEFKSTSDTEVLIYLYQEYGLKALNMLNGMFSFALFDLKTKELLLARDRMGKKPLYYTETSNTFVFASELKAILKHPIVSKEINLESINQYLTFDYIPTPLTTYKNIFKLEPAHYLIIKNNEIVKKAKFWEYDFRTNHAISFDVAKQELDKLLDKAVSSRLMSDVPLGVFLSGGLDSSAITYYAQKNSFTKINTFSIGFDDKSYDEQEFALQVANFLGTNHHLSILTPEKTVELVQEIFPKLDEPFADASIIPTYFLSKFTREHVTVALGGDGSDELLAGYPTFISENYRKLNTMMPNWLNKFLLSAANILLRPSDNNISFDFKVKQFLRGFTSNENHIHQLWLGSFIIGEKQKLFKKDVLNQLSGSTGLNLIDTHFSSAKSLNADKWHSLIYYYCQTYLLDDILFKVDRASMYNSLEVRAPFMDRNVVEFVNSLPKGFKIKGNNGKLILKELMRDKIPNIIIDRPKKGFGIPLSEWLRTRLKNEVYETLSQKDDLFDQNYIQQLWNEHQNKKNNHRKLLWNLYVLKKTVAI